MWVGVLVALAEPSLLPRVALLEPWAWISIAQIWSMRPWASMRMPKNEASAKFRSERGEVH